MGECGPVNGPDFQKKHKQEEMGAWQDEKARLQETRRSEGMFDVARAKLERCVVPSMPCVPNEECSGKTRRSADIQMLTET